MRIGEEETRLHIDDAKPDSESSKPSPRPRASGLGVVPAALRLIFLGDYPKRE
jgi:hypothetical protein